MNYHQTRYTIVTLLIAAVCLPMAGPAAQESLASEGPPLRGSFSPDGKHVAWMSLRNGYPSVFVLHLDQPEIQTELTPKPGEIPASAFVSRAPAWSRNGKYIFFTRREPGTNGEEIYVMNYDGTGVSPLTGAIGNDSEAAAR